MLVLNSIYNNIAVWFTGFRELLELIYATDTVPHLISGKAIARAIRGHYLVDAALQVIMLGEFFVGNPDCEF